MNILFLSELFYPHGGGAELATYLYAKLLAEAKVNVVVVTNRFSGEPEYSDNEGFRVYRLPLFNRAENVKYAILKRSDILFSSFMRKLIRWADVVYVPRFWFSAIPVAKAMSKPVITHLHDYIAVCPLAVLYDFKAGKVCEKNGFCSAECIYTYESYRRRGFVKAFGSALLNLTVWPLLRKFIENSDSIICVSKAQKDAIIKRAPKLKEKLRVIYNPLPNLPLVEMSGNDFGYFGGPSYLKGYHVLLKALRHLKMQKHNSIIVHATKFRFLNSQLYKILKGLGVLTYKKLPDIEYANLYRNIKAIIFPSIWEEPLPYVIIEALLMGRLIITSRVGGIPELLKTCKGIFMFTPGDYIQLAEAIEVTSNMNKECAFECLMSSICMLKKKLANNRILSDFLAICYKLVS